MQPSIRASLLMKCVARTVLNRRVIESSINIDVLGLQQACHLLSPSVAPSFAHFRPTLDVLTGVSSFMSV